MSSLFKDIPIRRKLIFLFMLVSVVAMLMMRAAFFAYEYRSFREATSRQLSTLGKVIADNSTAALAFSNQADANEILSALHADPNIVAAALYGRDGKLFAQYPANLPAARLPATVGEEGFRFVPARLTGFQSVVQRDRRLGTLYLELDTGTMLSTWFRDSFGIAIAVMTIVLLLTFLLSRVLQNQISRPILALADTAKAVSDRSDYSARAPKFGHDELGLLTDAFNQMLAQIQEQNRALSESEARVRAVLNSALSAVVVMDARGAIIDWNVRAEGMFGWTRAEALGRHLADTLIPPRYREAHTRGLEHFHTTGEGPALSRPFELSALRRDGTEFPVELSISPIRNGDVVTFCGFITDITERKRAAEVLQKSQELLQAIVDNSPAVIYVKDLDGRYLLVNRRYEEIFTLTREDILGKTDREIFPAAAAAAFEAMDRRVAAAGHALTEEEIAPHRDGPHVYLSVKCPLRDPTGHTYGVFGLSTDITERKQAETEINRLNQDLERRVAARTAELETANAELHRSRAIFENFFTSLPGLFLVLTPELKIVAASDAYLKATMTTREGILGRGLFDVFPDNPSDPAATGVSNLRASLDRVRQKTESDTMAIQKYDVRRPDGVFEERYWSPINSPVVGADGRLEYLIHRVEDVTDFVHKKASSSSGDGAELRTRMEQMEAEIFQSSQKVQAANQKLEAANKELEAFSYSVSHDLRAPLRHVDGFANLLAKRAESVLDSQSQRYIATISGAAKQMGRLIDDLLSFSRMNRATLHFSEVDQNALIAAVIRDGHYDQRGVMIVWEIAPLPAVKADAAMLRQVWVNLIENAVKYSGKNPQPRIAIGVHRAADRPDEPTFFVRDNGVGFDMAYAGKLFGVFQRLHSPSDFEGTGIGLANIRRIVMRHGGRTWAEGRVGEGAVFYFSLPVTPSSP